MDEKDKMKARLLEAKKKSGKEKESALMAVAEEFQAAEAYNELGIYYKDETGEPEKALEMFEKGIALSPRTAALYNNQASCYVNMAVKSEERREEYMAAAVSLFEKAGKLNSVGYFFLGNLYMPKINPPFPDDYEKAAGYFKKVDRDAGACWFSALNKLGIYYYHEKKDYVRAAACFSLAVKLGGTDKQYKNNFEMAFSKVRNRKFWKEKMDALELPGQIDEMAETGEKRLIPVCPRCKSREIGRYSVAENLRRSLAGGIKKKIHYHSYCKKCGYEW